MNDLSELFKAAAEEKRKLKEQEEKSQAGQALKAVQERLKQNNEINELLEVFVEKNANPKEVVKEIVVEKEVVKEVVNSDSFQQPKPQPIDPNFTALQKKVQFLEQAIGRIAATGPGSGEVNLRWLDDVDRSTIADNRYLRYNESTKKFIFDDVDSVGDYITLYDTTDQTLAVSVPKVLTINTVDQSRSISVVDGSKITFSKAGTYNIQYNIQAVNADNAQWDVSVWLKVNGVNHPDSNSIFTVPARKTSSIYGKLILSSPVPVDVVAGDYVEILAHTESSLVTIKTIPEDAVNGIPRTPSVIIVVNKL